MKVGSLLYLKSPTAPVASHSIFPTDHALIEVHTKQRRTTRATPKCSFLFWTSPWMSLWSRFSSCGSCYDNTCKWTWYLYIMCRFIFLSALIFVPQAHSYSMSQRTSKIYSNSVSNHSHLPERNCRLYSWWFIMFFQLIDLLSNL